MAVLSAEAFFRWLPDDEDEIARHFGGDGHTVQPWVAKGTEHIERRLDRYDPYSAATALDRPFPSDWTRDLLGTVADDEVIRSWSIDGKPPIAQMPGGLRAVGVITPGARVDAACLSVVTHCFPCSRHPSVVLSWHSPPRNTIEGNRADVLEIRAALPIGRW